MEQNMMLYLGAVVLGALHAFEPGHGKTIIATYMIGTRGRAVDGILLGLIVTFTHTFSVILLGIIARILSHTYSEQDLHAWMGLLSSLLILSVGLWMLKNRLSGHGGHRHLHVFGSDLHHHDHTHDCHTRHHDAPDENHTLNHSHSHHEHPARDDHHHGSVFPDKQEKRFNMAHLFLLGISGGLVPCPAAIATLLTAIAAGKIAQGLTVAVFFSIGLGLVMMTIGVALSQASKFTEKIGSSLEFSKKMGILSACIITMLGCYTLYHSLIGLLA